MATSNSSGNLLNTKQEKLAFLQNLILVAIADRYVDEKENDFLLMIGKQLNLSEEDTRPITDNLSLLSFIIPKEGKQKAIELQTLIIMMLKDGKVEEREYNLCLEYARRIGYNKEKFDNLIVQLGKK